MLKVYNNYIGTRCLQHQITLFFLSPKSIFNCGNRLKKTHKRLLPHPASSLPPLYYTLKKGWMLFTNTYFKYRHTQEILRALFQTITIKQVVILRRNMPVSCFATFVNYKDVYSFPKFSNILISRNLVIWWLELTKGSMIPNDVIL